MQQSYAVIGHGERNAHTSIDWKVGKKKGSGLGNQHSHNMPHERLKDKSDFTMLQDSSHLVMHQPPKTSSGRPTTKKLAA